MFWDHANFYGDIDLGEESRLRDSVGGGIRLVLPFLLGARGLRLPAEKGSRERQGALYFAIGQAF
jgi:hypothetical protein